LTRQHVLYFFFDDKYDKQKTATSLIRALLHQFIRLVPDLITYATPEYHSHGEAMVQSLDTLWKIFLAALADGKLSDGVYLVVDPLDECEESSRKFLPRYFEDYFATISPAKDSDLTTFLQVLVTSRPYPRIERLLKPSFCIRLRTENDEVNINRDIISFIADKTEQLRHEGYSDSVIQEDRESLTIKADGMFLCVSIIIEDLRGTPLQAIRSKLKSLPSGLAGLYQQLLNQLTTRHGVAEMAMKMLMWVVHAPRPMSVEELAWACTITANHKYISWVDEAMIRDFILNIKLCGPLLKLGGDGTVKLVHQSAYVYDQPQNRFFLAANHPNQKRILGSDRCLLLSRHIT
jgi:hypothetical protein